MNAAEPDPGKRKPGRKILHIPKAGLPEWHPPEEADTPVHHRLRVSIIAVAGLLYATIIFLHVFQVVKQPKSVLVALGLLIMVAMPAVDTLIRPGKAQTWWVTTAVVVIVFLFPPSLLFFLVLFPMGLLVKQALNSRKRTEK